MKPLVEWVRRPEPAGCITAGWRLLVGGAYRGCVWLDGSATRTPNGGYREFGSQPLAAQALLRAAGVEP